MSLVSLYDEASLWMTPSGVKDGRLYSQLPVPVYGPELVTNGDFDTDSDWNKSSGVTISGGKANFVVTSGGYQYMSQSITYTVGKEYILTADIVGTAGKACTFYDASGNNGGLKSTNGQVHFDGTSQRIQKRFTANSNSNTILVARNGSGDYTFNIDNVSVKEITNSGDFTFSRGSNLAATRVGPDGLIEKGRENLLLQSNNFGTTWVTPDATITSGQADKDGSNNAWLLTATSAFNRVVQSISQSGVKRFSVYAKANTNDYLLLGSFEGAHFYATFNLATGAVDSNNANAISPSIEDVGGGWYRCSATWISTTTEVRIASQATSGQGGWASTTSGSVLIQNAQLEQGLAATDYIETGITTGKAGLLEDEPRLDYSGGATCPSLLLEPQRTNQVQNSEYYESYAINSLSIESNQTTSPEGLQNAAELIEDSSNDNHFFRIPNLSWTSGADVVFSIYLKENTRRYARLRFDNSGTQTRAWLDLRTGETTFVDVGAENGVCTSVDYGNGWFKYDFKITAQNTGTGSVQIFTQSVESVTGSLQTTYQGDGTSGIYAWGAQVEAGSYPTSYIPNHSGGSVTRGADSCNSSSVSTSTDFTIFFEAKDFCLINGGTTTGYANVQFVFGAGQSAYDAGGSYHIYANALYYYNGSTNTNFGVIFNNQTDSKFALVKRGNKGIIYANGAKKTEITLPSGADAKVINWDTINLTQSLQDAQGDVFGSNYKQLLKFNTALTDSELTELTINGIKEELITAYKKRATTLEEGASERLDTYLQSLEDFIII